VPDNGSVGSHGCCDLYPGADTIQFSSRRARSVRSASLATLFILVSPRWVNTRCPAHDTWRGQPQSRRARIVHRVSGTVGGGHASSTVESNRGIAAGNGRPPAERNPQAPCNARSSKQSRQRKGWMQLSVPGLGSHCRPARDGPKWGVSCPSPQLRPPTSLPRHPPAIRPLLAPAASNIPASSNHTSSIREVCGPRLRGYIPLAESLRIHSLTKPKSGQFLSTRD
jgi:hypothetical protein